MHITRRISLLLTAVLLGVVLSGCAAFGGGGSYGSYRRPMYARDYDCRYSPSYGCAHSGAYTNDYFHGNAPYLGGAGLHGHLGGHSPFLSRQFGHGRGHGFGVHGGVGHGSRVGGHLSLGGHR